MCLVIFALRAHPDYPLVVAANRDEFHGRPTASSRFWPQQPELLAGRDLDQGGTWMGISRDGRFAAITNYRDPARTAPAPRSRGELTLDFLTGNSRPEDYLAQLAEVADDYAGFNLLVGNSDSLWYYTNSLAAPQRRAQELPPGIYGLSNARLDTPWPKVMAGRERLAQALEKEPQHDELAAVVNNRELAQPGQLQALDLHGEMDQLLSAQFIVTEIYGTRSTTTLWLDQAGHAHWREQSFDALGSLTGTTEEAFELGAPYTTGL